MELSGKEEEVVKVSPPDNPALVKARLKKRMEVYQDDRTVARLVRGSIMGLKTNQEPTQEDDRVEQDVPTPGSQGGTQGHYQHLPNIGSPVWRTSRF